MRKLLEKDVEFEIAVLAEDMPVRGNALVSGDDDLDTQAENEIIEDYNNGNEWAWCTVRVTARWRDFVGADFLGGCSYESEKDFIAGGYYEDMKARALATLNNELKTVKGKLEELA